ncbi:hypothetical protein CHISP_0958 [Chitinispirillum alkaliphilum]|nr:hypothetical protein CHISP_0958 [Chitinispirillum alkaliphilum]
MIKSARIISLVACGISLAFSQIQPIVNDDLGEGSVDWGSRTILATGIGAPNPELPTATQRPSATRAAQMIALRNAIETVRGITLNSSTTVENLMVTNDRINTSVEGFVRGFQQKGRTRYMSDGTVEITMEIPLDQISMEVLGNELNDSPSTSVFQGQKASTPTIFTGLVIDARELDIRPALSPKVLDENGLEVYGSAYVSREWASTHGIVGYSRELSEAARMDRVGDTPGMVKAIRASGPNRADIVISNNDAADIRSASENLKFLSECRVIIVID